MTQRPLFAKSAKFRRPRRVVNRWGDTYRVWLLPDGTGKVCLVDQICGVKVRPSFKAIIVNEHGEYLVSRHRKLKPALTAVVRATEQPTPKRKKVRG